MLLMVAFVYRVRVCFFFKQKTAYELRISDWSSDVCSSDLMTQIDQRARLAREGMYRPEFESDACGVGLVAATDGRASRRVVQSAIDALKAVWHRGAVDADGQTGDGAGLHLDLPTAFFDDAIT